MEIYLDGDIFWRAEILMPKFCDFTRSDDKEVSRDFVFIQTIGGLVASLCRPSVKLER